MHFDDGTNPWFDAENQIQVFNFGFFKSNSFRISSLWCYIGPLVMFAIFGRNF